jgi:PilZ domain
MQDRRGSVRRRTYLCGRIAFNSRHSTLDCIVRNLSHNGAMLEFAEPVLPSGEFDFCIVGKGENRRGRLIWRDGPRIGVTTDNAIANPVISLETERLIRKLKADRAALAGRLGDGREPA